MKTVLLHGLGQTAQDWKEVVRQLSASHVDCPELFDSTGNEIFYSRILAALERQYSDVASLDFTSQLNKVTSAICIRLSL